MSKISTLHSISVCLEWSKYILSHHNFFELYTKKKSLIFNDIDFISKKIEDSILFIPHNIRDFDILLQMHQTKLKQWK